MMTKLQFSQMILCLLLIISATAYLHKNNDGLWFQGDAPRHAMNGAFWGDFLASGDYLQPREFALDYYKHYPAITPTIWPPFVYWVEAVVFRIFGVSTDGAKGVVLFFSFLYGLYLILFVEELGGGRLAGWLVLLSLVQPAFLIWSNAVMMDIPALALGTACIFHLERAAHDQGRRHMVAAVVFAVACALTRQAGIVLPVAYATALVSSGNGKRLLKLDSILLWLMGGVFLIPWIFINLKYGAIMAKEATYLGQFTLFSLDNWLYYLWTMPANFQPWFMSMVAGSCAMGYLLSDLRARILKLLIAGVIVLGAYSLISLKAPRYVIGVLPLAGSLVALGIGVSLRQTSTIITGLLTSAIITLCVYSVVTTEAPSLRGMRVAVNDVLKRYKGERLLYDGLYDGVFAFYLRANPERGNIKLIRGGKIFYATALQKQFGLIEFVNDAESFKSIISQLGCRWLIFEREEVVGVQAAQITRRVVMSDPSFRRVKSYPLSTNSVPQVTYLDVYEYLGPLTDTVSEKLVFPVLGE